MNMMKTLVARAWQTADGKMMLFRDERYYVFSDAQAIDDHGYIEYDQAEQCRYLQSQGAHGKLEFFR